MASNEELMRIYNMLTDTWRLYRKYADVQGTDQYWDSLVEESRAISKKYGECKFIIDLVLAVINELERKAKESGDKDGQASGR